MVGRLICKFMCRQMSWEAMRRAVVLIKLVMILMS